MEHKLRLGRGITRKEEEGRLGQCGSWIIDGGGWDDTDECRAGMCVVVIARLDD